MRLLQRKQRGIIAIIVAVALFAVLLVAGLALDTGHVFSNKSRFQSVVDAAALAAAKTLDATGDVNLASASATAVFNTNKAAFPAMAGVAAPTPAYSNTVSPFVPGSTPARYVRITSTGFTTQASLARLVGVNTFSLRASAVAGPSPTINQACNVVPMGVCGDPAAGAPNWGYQTGKVQMLKETNTIGPGNYQLLDFSDNGAAGVRTNLAGAYAGCVSVSGTVQTKPGSSTGPVSQGLNTRFGDYGGPMGGTEAIYPSDTNVTKPSPVLKGDVDTGLVKQGSTVVTWTSQIGYSHATNYVGGNGRRELAVPIVNCAAAGGSGGVNTLNVLGLGCFFLLQPVPTTGPAKERVVVAEYISDCIAGGQPGPAPTTVPGPHIIQLYRDPASDDS